jgi:threonine/homoserine/homoserine lactone efflux protein
MTNCLSLFAVFAASFAVAFSGAMMPGPLLTAAIAESSTRGFIAGPLLILGHAILEAALLAALLLGFSSVLGTDAVFAFISLLGGCILFWMAIGMFRSLPRLRLSFEASNKAHHRLVVTGVVMSVSNPYWILWWATVGLGICIQSRQFGLPGVGAFFIGHISADFIWYGAVAYAVGKGRKFLSDRIYRGLVGSLAVAMAAFALFFIVSGLKKTGMVFR